jgi:type IV pilus assembly protein PilQ
MITARWVKALAGAATMVLVLASPAALAQNNQVKQMEANVLGEQTVFTVDLQGPLAQKPADFTTQNPAKIAIDFFDTGFAAGRPVRVRRQGAQERQRDADRGPHTRGAEPEPVDNIPHRGARQPVRGDAGQRPAGRNWRGADVRTGGDGADIGDGSESSVDSEHRFPSRGRWRGRVVVDLSSRDSGINIAQQGQNLVVDFMGTSVPADLRRRFDVTDFGTPIQSMRASDANGSAKLTIEPRGNWEYSSYQTDNQFVVEVRQVKDDPNKLIAGQGFRGERLSLNFQNIDIRSLLQVFADFTNLNIITSDTVQGNLTLRLKDVPWDQALQIVMDSKGLASRRNGNVLWVAPKAELATKEKLELEAMQQINELEPIRSQVFQLNYQRADDVRKMLLGMVTGTAGAAGAMPVPVGGAAGMMGATRMLSKRGSLTADPRTNQLFVSDVSSKLEEVQIFLQKIDIPVRQVIIEARIVEASDTFSRNLGVKLGFALPKSGSSLSSNYGNSLPNATNDGTPALSLPAAAINSVNPATAAFSIFNAAAGRFLDLELSALEADGKGKIISSPRVVTANNIKALIEQGTELPYQSATSSGATSVQFRKANLKLEVTPQITPEGNVLLDVDVNKDSVGIRTDNGFAIDTKHVQTQVLVENGGTVVIGGIYSQEESIP